MSLLRVASHAFLAIVIVCLAVGSTSLPVWAKFFADDESLMPQIDQSSDLSPLIVDDRNRGNYFRGRSAPPPALGGPPPRFDSVIESAWPDPWTLDDVVNLLEAIRPELEKSMDRFSDRHTALKIFIGPELFSGDRSKDELVCLKIAEILRMALARYEVPIAVTIGVAEPHSTDLQIAAGHAASAGVVPWRVEVLNLDSDPQVCSSVNALVTMILQGAAFPYKKTPVDAGRYAGLGQVSEDDFKRFLSNVFDGAQASAVPNGK